MASSVGPSGVNKVPDMGQQETGKAKKSRMLDSAKEALEQSSSGTSKKLKRDVKPTENKKAADIGKDAFETEMVDLKMGRKEQVDTKLAGLHSRFDAILKFYKQAKEEGAEEQAKTKNIIQAELLVIKEAMAELEANPELDETQRKTLEDLGLRYKNALNRPEMKPFEQTYNLDYIANRIKEGKFVKNYEVADAIGCAKAQILSKELEPSEEEELRKTVEEVEEKLATDKDQAKVKAIISLQGGIDTLYRRSQQ